MINLLVFADADGDAIDRGAQASTIEGSHLQMGQQQVSMGFLTHTRSGRTQAGKVAT